MTQIDEAEFKRTIAALAKQMPPGANSGLVWPSPDSETRAAIAKQLEPVLTKAGLDKTTLNKLLAQAGAEQRAAFEKQKADMAKNAPALEKANQARIAMMKEASNCCRSPSPPPP